MNLLVVSCGSATGKSYYRKNRLGVFEKWLLMKALEYNKKEVTGGWRKIA